MSPFLLLKMTVQAKHIKDLLEEELKAMDLFLVELNVSSSNEVTAFVDGMVNVTIEQCSRISRTLREKLGEGYDDVEITVSSPGLDRPFSHINQFIKNIGKSVEVLLTDGTKITGKLTEATEEKIVIQEFAKIKGNAKAAKPTLSDKITDLKMNEVKQTKKMIIF